MTVGRGAKRHSQPRETPMRALGLTHRTGAAARPSPAELGQQRGLAQRLQEVAQVNLGLGVWFLRRVCASRVWQA